MRIVRRDAVQKGLPIYLDAADTKSAPSFYRKLGFEQMGTIRCPNINTVLMSMILEPTSHSEILDT